MERIYHPVTRHYLGLLIWDGDGGGLIAENGGGLVAENRDGVEMWHPTRQAALLWLRAQRIGPEA